VTPVDGPSVTDVAVVQDRVRVLVFQPGAAAVHAQAGKWFDDKEIYEWFAVTPHWVRGRSLWHYVRASAGADWTDVLAVEDENWRAPDRRATGQQLLLKHGDAGQGVRRGRRRMPGNDL
jgi:hypothetical protein